MTSPSFIIFHQNPFHFHNAISDLNPNAEPFFPQNLAVPMPKTHQSRMVYVPKRTRIQQKTTKSTHHRVGISIPFPKTIEEAEALHITTVMNRNIPNQFRFDNLLMILDVHCFEINKNADPADWSKFELHGKETLIRIFSQKVFRCKSLDFLPILFSAGRDGFNHRMSGISIGIHVRGLPFTRRNI